MKTKLVLFVLLVFSLSVYAQNEKKTTGTQKTMSRAQLAEVKFVTDLMPENLRNSNILFVETVSQNKGRLTTSQGNKNEIDTGFREILTTADKKTKIYIDVKYSDPNDKIRKQYKLALSILVTE